MARTSDGRVGVSVNAGTVKVLDVVIQHMRASLGINASYTQAIQYLAHEYIVRNETILDNVTE
jgi:hypothetical protein